MHAACDNRMILTSLQSDFQSTPLNLKYAFITLLCVSTINWVLPELETTRLWISKHAIRNDYEVLSILI